MSNSSHQRERHAWQSSKRVIHLDLACTGLDRMREAGREPADYLSPVPYKHLGDLLDLTLPGLTERATLCRICAAAPTAVAAVLATRPGTRDTFATFTIDRPSSDQKRRRPRTFSTEEFDRLRPMREAGEVSLRRIADHLGAQVTTSTRGATVFGFLSAAELDSLSKVLRVEVRRSVTELPPAEQVATFWALLTRDRGQAEEGSDQDPWFLAELIHDSPV